MKRILNWIPSPKDPRDQLSVRYLSSPTLLPNSFQLPKAIPIYDQLDAGSCTGNTSCANYRFESYQLLGNLDFEPSRLFQYYNARFLEGNTQEDSGAYIRDAYKAMNKFGLCDEKLWPYLTSKVTNNPPPESYQDALNNTVIKYASVIQNENIIKQTLMSGAAISFGFNVYSSFFNGWDKITGIMPIPKAHENLEGGHAVSIIGWDDSKKSFLIQNSWGTDWGINGLFWMPYEYLLNASECDDFWCIEEIKVLSPVNPPVPVNNWESFAKQVFVNITELTYLKKSSLVRLGVGLGLLTSDKKTFKVNLELVRQKLKL